MESSEEPITRTVAGEDASCAVAAIGGGRKADNHQSRHRIAETGERPAPVIPVTKAGDLFACYLFPPGNKARATAADDDVVVEPVKRVGHESIVGRVPWDVDARRDMQELRWDG